MSGAELASVDRLGGLMARSDDEDIKLAAGRTVVVRGQDVSLVAEHDVELRGHSVELVAGGYNEHVEVHTSGGVLIAGMLSIARTFLTVLGSRDTVSGLRRRSTEDVVSGDRCTGGSLCAIRRGCVGCGRAQGSM